MICKHCGENLTGTGLIAWINHSCNIHVVEFKPMTDGEMRQAFLELGMPSIGFEGMGYAPPTEMERIIFEKPRE